MHVTPDLCFHRADSPLRRHSLSWARQGAATSWIHRWSFGTRDHRVLVHLHKHAEMSDWSLWQKRKVRLCVDLHTHLSQTLCNQGDCSRLVDTTSHLAVISVIWRRWLCVHWWGDKRQRSVVTHVKSFSMSSYYKFCRNKQNNICGNTSAFVWRTLRTNKQHMLSKWLNQYLTQHTVNFWPQEWKYQILSNSDTKRTI